MPKRSEHAACLLSSTVSKPLSHSEQAKPQGPLLAKGRKIRVLYFFAGKKRKCDVGHWILKLTDGNAEIVEIDMFRDPNQDLTIAALQESWLALIRTVNIVICTPPCATWSRSPWSNNFGPKPVRNHTWPMGFPWLATKNRKKVDIANELI